VSEAEYLRAVRYADYETSSALVARYLREADDKVRSGRDLMENDGKHEPPHVSLAEHCAPEHPNFREQYQRMGEQTT
jgi:hypothetical protein